MKKKDLQTLVKGIIKESLYNTELDSVAVQPRDRPEDYSKSLDDKQKQQDELLLQWAQQRLSRESNPNNRDVLEKLIKMLQKDTTKN